MTKFPSPHHIYMMFLCEPVDKQVNNAGTLGVSVDEEGLKALKISSETWVSH